MDVKYSWDIYKNIMDIKDIRDIKYIGDTLHRNRMDINDIKYTIWLFSVEIGTHFWGLDTVA